MNTQCTRCGAIIEADDLFCSNCGQRRQEQPRLNFSQAPATAQHQSSVATQLSSGASVQAGGNVNATPPAADGDISNTPASVRPSSPSMFLDGSRTEGSARTVGKPQSGRINCLICGIRPALNTGEHCGICVEKLNRKPEQWDAERAAQPPPISQEIGGLSGRTKVFGSAVVGICLIAVVAALGHSGQSVGNGTQYNPVAVAPRPSTALPSTVVSAPQSGNIIASPAQPAATTAKGYWFYEEDQVSFDPNDTRRNPVIVVHNDSDQMWSNTVVTINRSGSPYSVTVGQVYPHNLTTITLSDAASGSGLRFDARISKVLTVDVSANGPTGMVVGTLPIGARILPKSYVTTPDYHGSDSPAVDGNDNVPKVMNDTPAPYQFNPDGSIKTD